MMHSTVCAWIPLVISIMRNMISMICAPPMIVLMREAWPGQSTRVNCRYYSFIYLSNLVGTLVKKAENPRSRVIPLSCDWGFLSRLAVDVTSLSILQMEVFPESTCPKTPTLIFKHLMGRIVVIYYFVKSNNYFYIYQYIMIMVLSR